MCGPVQTNDTGMIESGDGYLNGLYGRNVKCTWVIKPKTQYKMIMLDITHLSMESSNDCEKGHVKVSLLFQPPRGKTNNVVSEQVRHKPDCTVTEAG